MLLNVSNVVEFLLQLHQILPLKVWVDDVVELIVDAHLGPFYLVEAPHLLCPVSEAFRNAEFEIGFRSDLWLFCNLRTLEVVLGLFLELLGEPRQLVFERRDRFL